MDIPDSFKNSSRFYREANTLSDIDRLFKRVDALITSTYNSIQPVLKAGGGKDREALMGLVFKNSLEQVRSFSKEELQIILARSVADGTMEEVDKHPFGGTSNDLLS